MTGRAIGLVAPAERHLGLVMAGEGGLTPVPAAILRVYRLRRGGGGEHQEGYQIGNALPSYVHLHFASNPDMAHAFVAACAGV